MTCSDYVYVDSHQALAQALASLRQAEVVAVDTEFARFNTYYPIVGLVQIYDGQQCYLIDPCALDSLEDLAALLTDTNITKVLHACSEDMEVFHRCTGVVPMPVFDTQIAAAALGVGFSVGYQALVAHYLDITLPKDETRSDWLQRPLSQSQLDYARLDVVYLLQVYERQFAALNDAGRLAWVEAETASLGKDTPTTMPPEDCYKKMGGLGRLDRRQLGVLRALFSWRETFARERDIPRNRVVDQKALYAMARQGAASKEDLQQVEGLTPGQIRRFGEELLSLMAEARQLPEDDCPPKAPPSTQVNRTLLKQLQQLVAKRAEALGVAPELLVKRRHLEQLIRSADDSGDGGGVGGGAGGEVGSGDGSTKGGYRLPPELTGWRQAVIGDELLAALAGKAPS